MIQNSINIGSFKVSNNLPFFLIAGPCSIEGNDHAIDHAGKINDICKSLNINFVFKSSFDKANRSSIKSFRGPGLEKGLRILEKIKTEFDVPILTDIHESQQAAPAAEVADVLQLPAFLSRQTDLIIALAKTNAVLPIKKAQFLAPPEMGNIINKCENSGNSQLILCERGSSFGYNNLVVDMLGFSELKEFAYPVLFDVTHALQRPGGLGDAAAGRRESVRELALAGLSQKIAGLFLEAHPEPEKALCDGPCALRLNQLKPFLQQMKAIDDLVKTFDPLNTA